MASLGVLSMPHAAAVSEADQLLEGKVLGELGCHCVTCPCGEASREGQGGGECAGQQLVSLMLIFSQLDLPSMQRHAPVDTGAELSQRHGHCTAEHRAQSARSRPDRVERIAHPCSQSPHAAGCQQDHQDDDDQEQSTRGEPAQAPAARIAARSARRRPRRSGARRRVSRVSSSNPPSERAHAGNQRTAARPQGGLRFQSHRFDHPGAKLNPRRQPRIVLQVRHACSRTL